MDRHDLFRITFALANTRAALLLAEHSATGFQAVKPRVPGAQGQLGLDKALEGLLEAEQALAKLAIEGMQG